MPGLNGTGPMGEGPATGGGFGTCDGRTATADLNRRGMGRGAGRRGGGRGFFCRRRFGGAADPTADRPSLETEAATLKARLEVLEQRIAGLKAPDSEPRDG